MMQEVSQQHDIIPMGQNAREIEHFVNFFVNFFGYSPAEALGCATFVGCDLMGLKGELGAVKTRALADILLVEGSPLADPSALVRPRSTCDDRERWQDALRPGRQARRF